MSQTPDTSAARSLLDRITWPVVALVAVVAAVAFGALLTLAPTDRAEALHSIGSMLAPHITTALAALGALVAAYSARQSHRETVAQTPILETVARQTNGELTGRMREAVRYVLDEREAGDGTGEGPTDYSAEHAPPAPLTSGTPAPPQMPNIGRS